MNLETMITDLSWLPQSSKHPHNPYCHSALSKRNIRNKFKWKFKFKYMSLIFLNRLGPMEFDDDFRFIYSSVVLLVARRPNIWVLFAAFDNICHSAVLQPILLWFFFDRSGKLTHVIQFWRCSAFWHHFSTKRSYVKPLKFLDMT